MSEAPGPFRDSNEAPYWQRHYGIGQPWGATERGRRGCLWMLILTMVAIVLVGVAAGLVVLLR
jgi:hypothetical protein